jgi:carboxymethylenebutenolidase
MKFQLILLILTVLTMNIFSQEKSCCDTEAPNKMASFGKDDEFVKLHEEPLDYKHTNHLGEMITFATEDGKTANAYYVPTRSMQKANNWLLVFHEWWGLNDHIKREADEWADKLGNVNVLALDLYDGKVASTQEEARNYVQSVNNERAFTIIGGAVKYAGDGASFATLGWCFGGAWSNQAAIYLAEKCKACVIYYGMPEQNKERLKNLKAPVLGIFAEQDKNITPEIAREFENNLKELGIINEIYFYDAVHAFANPSNPKHDAEKTADAKSKTESFLKKYMH